MLKEMTMLLIVLWGSRGMPTPTPTATSNPPQEEDFRGLSELYCKAEALLQEYKSVDKKHLPAEVKSKMGSDFSQPDCNFTKSAEECELLGDFRELFAWLKDIHQLDGLLKPVMGTFTLLMELQNDYVNHTCSPSDRTPQFDCPKYSEEHEGPSRENMFHYIFELYEIFTRKLLSSKLKLEQDNPSDVCKAKGD